jgi:hypothetical protein
MNEPTDEPALAGETKLEACEIEVRTLKEMYSAKLQEAAECDALLKNALLDCGAKAEAEARMMEEAESSLSSLPAGTY